MPPEDLVITKNYIATKLEKVDLIEVHILRGRFIHYMSILEHIMKQCCPLPNTSSPDKRTFGAVKHTFVKFVKQNFRHGVIRFEKNINFLNDYRNEWAHGMIYYCRPTRKRPNKPNNYVHSLSAGKISTKKYFSNLNKSVESVFKFLVKKGLLSIKGYTISAGYVVKRQSNTGTVQDSD